MNLLNFLKLIGEEVESSTVTLLGDISKQISLTFVQIIRKCMIRT